MYHTQGCQPALRLVYLEVCEFFQGCPKIWDTPLTSLIKTINGNTNNQFINHNLGNSA